MKQPITVFISYSHDSEPHKKNIRRLYKKLRENAGVKADFDETLRQDETALNFDELSVKIATQYDKVIVVLSEGYKLKADNFKGGVGDELRVIISDIKVSPQKYILVTFEKLRPGIFPAALSGRDCLNLTKPGNMNLLINKLRGIKTLPVVEVNPNPTILPIINEIPDDDFQPTQSSDIIQTQGIHENSIVTNRNKASTELKHRLKEMLPDNQFQSVIEQIIQYTKEHNQATLNDQALQLQRQYNSWQEYQMLGLFSNSEESLTINKITRSLFQLIDKM
ncbi:MAG: SEFIR domain-containing protein [Bacteroidota bacterium]